MTNVIDRQTVVFSINLALLLPSVAQIPMNLRFAADELVLKSLTYSPGAVADNGDMVQIWCSLTNDNLIGTFPNGISLSYQHDEHFRLSNSFQTGNITFQFQTTANGAPFYYNPQTLISVGALVPVVGNTKGIVSFTVKFLKLKDKTLY